MTLELFTAIGALVGGSIAFLLDERLLSLAVRRPARCTWRSRWLGPGRDEPRPRRRRPPRSTPTPWTAEPSATRPTLDRLSGDGYRVRNLGRGVVGATGAGVASALLGIGGGIIKVPLMHLRWASRSGSRPRPAT